MVKIAVAVIVTLVAAVLAIPLVIGGGSGDASGCAAHVPDHGVAAILATIRSLESGGHYDARSSGSSASGAYQYIDTTWQSWASRIGIDVVEYPRAYLAPPAVQDAVAAANVGAILDSYGGDVAMVPVIWYYPIAATDPSLMDIVPHPEAGNRLTVREYQTLWLRTYSRVATGSVGDEEQHELCESARSARG